MRLAAPLLLVTMLAGCTPGAQPDAHDNEAARNEQIHQLAGWDRLFGAPDAAVGAANQFGFRPTPYEAKGPAFASTGGPVMIAGSNAPRPNTAGFLAEGAKAEQIDTIRFDLTIPDEATAKDARARFAKLVRDYLFLSGIDAEALVPAITQGVAARGDLEGTPYSIDPAGSRLTVTFTRAGDGTPANSQPQGN